MLEKHIEMQHLTGLYEKIRSVNTPEEIAKWIEERKVKYPTKENIQKRYEKQEEIFKRGEKIRERQNRFGRDNTRLARKQKRPRRKKPEKAVKMEEKAKSLIDEKCDWNGSMFPFRGTRELFNEESEKEESEYEDEEWSLDCANEAPVELNNALGALMGAYNSDEDDDEGPVEQKIERREEEAGGVEVNEKKPRKRRRPHSDKKKIDKNVQSGPRLKFSRRRITLLEKLLDSEIRHERNVLLQCVQYVVNNNFFREESS